MDVRSVMTPDPACCTPDTPLTEVAQLMVQHDCGEIPVVGDTSGRRPVGVVTDRDIVVRTIAQGRDPRQCRAADAMSTPAVTVTPDTTLEDCCDLMEEHQIRRVPVVDTAGAVCGIVAVADVAREAGKRTTANVVREVSEPNGASLR